MIMASKMRQKQFGPQGEGHRCQFVFTSSV